ncbi:MAG: nucleotidyl transferase AbiEii/AbiGii toxin family protein [Actinomycetota bacterium]
MKYQSGAAFRDALEARLSQSTSGIQDLQRRRRAIAFDRLLARIAAAEHDAWLLKGGAALEFRLADRARMTKDIDLALLEDADPVDVLLDDLARDHFGDHFTFSIVKRSELGAQDDRGPVTRLSMEARLGGRTFEKFVVDIVTPTANPEEVEWIELGHRLAFAEVPTIRLPVIDLRTHWAEKLSAYVRRYDDRPNTRVKDLVDLVLLIDHGLEPDADLFGAVVRTFDNRSQTVPGDTVPSMAAEWQEAFEPLAWDLALTTPDAFTAHEVVEQFWQRCIAVTEGDANGS